MIKKNRLIDISIVIFPAIFMAFISFLSFININEVLNLKGLFVISLIFIFPIFFLIQGIFCALREVNYLISLSISVLAFLNIIFILLNGSALVYLVLYILFSLTGYLFAKRTINSAIGGLNIVK